MTAQFSFGAHELSASVLQRYLAYNPGPSQSPTDFALRYAIPIRRIVLTLAGDVQNAFAGGEDEPFFAGRATRLWARVTF